VGEQNQQLNAASIEEIAIVTTSAAAEYSRARGGFANVGPAGNKMNKGKSPASRGVPFATFCHIEALRESYQVGEPIELYVAIRNQSRKSVKVPISLSVSDGTALFLILDEARNPLPQPRSRARSVKRRTLLPGEWVLFKITLNGAGGYQLDRPGVYQVVLLGSELGLSDSTQMTLRIDP